MKKKSLVLVLLVLVGLVVVGGVFGFERRTGLSENILVQGMAPSIGDFHYNYDYITGAWIYMVTGECNSYVEAGSPCGRFNPQFYFHDRRKAYADINKKLSEATSFEEGVTGLCGSAFKEGLVLSVVGITPVDTSTTSSCEVDLNSLAAGTTAAPLFYDKYSDVVSSVKDYGWHCNGDICCSVMYPEICFESSVVGSFPTLDKVEEEEISQIISQPTESILPEEPEEEGAPPSGVFSTTPYSGPPAPTPGEGFYVTPRGKLIDEVWKVIQVKLGLADPEGSKVWNPPPNEGWFPFKEIYEPTAPVPAKEFKCPPSNKCQKVVEHAANYIGLGYKSPTNPGTGICSYDTPGCKLQCGAFVSSVFFYSGITPQPTGNGDRICYQKEEVVPLKNHFTNKELLQAGDMFSSWGLTDSGKKYGHTGIFVGRGTVSEPYSEKPYKKPYCYKTFTLNSGGDLIFIHSTWPVCYSKYDDLFGGPTKGLMTFCRHEKCCG